MKQEIFTNQLGTLIKVARKKVFFTGIAFCLLFVTGSSVFAQTETLSTGSYIINMGIVPQTQSNGLKPYGLIYDLLKNYNVPVKWVISQSKIKDGTDFTYLGVQYKGGTFIIPAEYRNATINGRITTFGVSGFTTTSPLTVDVTYTLTTAPRWVIDNSNNNHTIAEAFFVNAGLPTSAWANKTPAQLTGCDDIYVMPHASATWATYGPLLDWVTTHRGSFWGGCQTASNIENCFNPANTAQQLNFLSNNVGAAGNALVPVGHNDGTPPYIYQFPSSVASQFMGTADGAQQNGSEQIYLPKLGGSWRPSTEVIVYDPSQADVPGISPGPAASIVYGRAFGNTNYGFAMYEGGHNIGGTTPPTTDQIAAQRAFWNFSFRSALLKATINATINLADIQVSGNSYNAAVTVSSTDAPFTFQWSSGCGGTFSNPTGQNTIFTPPYVTNFTYCTITCMVTDACGRSAFSTKVIQIFPPKTNPDFNSTFVNQPVPGNVNTNDFVPAAATYSTTPTLLSSPAGSSPSITMNSNGTYSFVSDKVGVYTYDVPVCVPNGSFSATGGTITNSGIYTIHTFTTSGTFTPSAAVNVEVLVVAGGGGGAGNGNSTEHCMGSGGAGGLIYNAAYAVTAGAKTVTIGAGGVGGSAGNSPTGNNATNGGNSVFATITATGGGAGRQSANGVAGGSGGGGGAWGANWVGGAASPAGQGYKGGDGLFGIADFHGGGGGGSASMPGLSTGIGGNGTSYSISGSPVTYATGGSHGGAAGAANTGNGGGGAIKLLAGAAGTAGGSGIVVVRYLTATTCYPTKLTITVLEPYLTSNAPVANVDIANTLLNVPVTLKTLQNDAAGSPDFTLVPATVAVTVAPLHGTTSVNSTTGDITFTPTTGYVGFDTLTYQVCDNQSPAKCATAKQIITITTSGSPNPNLTTAADDYKITLVNQTATGNVKTNDNDPEGNTQTVAAQNTSIAGKGTLVLLADGSYTFTPFTGYIGPVDFPYTTCDNGLPQACASATLHILVKPESVTAPDFNSTFVNIPVPGNVNTNDKVPAGTTYGTSPTLLSSPAGSSPALTMNSNGTYSFVSDKVGVYTYNVPVCVPGQTAPCPPTKLVITVLDSLSNTNSPVANVDIATTNLNTPVTLKTLANDAAGSMFTSLVASSVAVTVAPLHGTTSVNAATGNITFTPTTGYTGTDTLTYQVCDNQSPAKCATALQIITIRPAGSPNTTVAADDYKITNINAAASGNVKTNDSDPEGNTQTVTVQNTTVAGKGTLVLAADGSYTFTPVTGFTGPVDFPYTTCDNGTPQACASATLHILVRPEPPVLNPDFNVTWVDVPVSGSVKLNDEVPAGTTYTTSPVLLSSPAGSLPSITMNSGGQYTFVSNLPGIYTYDVAVCVPGQAAPCTPVKLVITVLDAYILNNPPVANVDYASTKVNTPVTLKTLSNDKSGNATTALDTASVIVIVAPLHGGSTSVNALTGDITYTPASGYVGWDTLTYQVCDNQSPTPNCVTAQQIITIRPTASGNTTIADDDYNITNFNTPVSGNVKTNDTDPEGDIQTVRAETQTVAGKGTFVFAADGSYTFTPVPGFSGPVSMRYFIGDNGIPSDTARAVLYILVRPPLPDLSPSIFNDGTTLIQNTTRDNVIRIFNIGNGATTKAITFSIPKMLPAFEITINPLETSMDVFGGLPVTNSDWTIVEQASRYVFTSNLGVVIPAGGFIDVGLKVKAVGIINSTGNLSIQIIFGTGGGETPYNNNADNNTYSTN